MVVGCVVQETFKFDTTTNVSGGTGPPGGGYGGGGGYGYGLVGNTF